MHLERRVLVSDGTGFLGSHICEHLLNDGSQVICVDNFFTGQRRNIENLIDCKRFELLRHDITHPLFVEIDETFNLACPASPIHYQRYPVQTTKTSGLGAINMLGLSPQQLFSCRRQARSSLASSAEKSAPAFVPAVVESPLEPARKRGDGMMRLSAAALSAFLEGLDWTRVHAARETPAPMQPG